jgi:hypothetical protein
VLTGTGPGPKRCQARHGGLKSTRIRRVHDQPVCHQCRMLKPPRSSRRKPAVPDSLTRIDACDRKCPRTVPGNMPGNVPISSTFRPSTLWTAYPASWRPRATSHVPQAQLYKHRPTVRGGAGRRGARRPPTHTHPTPHTTPGALRTPHTGVSPHSKNGLVTWSSEFTVGHTPRSASHIGITPTRTRPPTARAPETRTSTSEFSSREATVSRSPSQRHAHAISISFVDGC